MEEKYAYQVRLTGILIRQNEILLVKQKVNHNRNWSLPGGRLEHGESIETGIIREIKEETGIVVSVRKLLYLCDKLDSNPPILHITFLLDYISGDLTMPTNEFDKSPIGDVKFVEFSNLNDYGFSNTFIDLVKNNFPGSGSYKGEKNNIGL